MRIITIAVFVGIFATSGLTFGACSKSQMSSELGAAGIGGDAAVTGDAAGADVGRAGTGGSGGSGGDDGGIAEVPERIPGSDTVSGGAIMKSDNFTLVLTTGQSPGGNELMRSANYRLQTGVIGVTQ